MRKIRRNKLSDKVESMSFIKKNVLLISLCFLLVMLSSIAYSALNKQLNITGDLIVRAVKDIRITSLELISTTNAASEQYNSKYTVNTVSLSVNLPNVGSTITYKASIKNLGTVPMEIDTLSSSLGSTSSGVTYTVDGIELGTVIEAGNTQEFTITLERKTSSTNKEASFLLELSCIESVPKYTDPILVGNDPNLLNGSLTPVVYDKTQKAWVVADTSEKWYDYSNQAWANAVILEDGVTKNVGDTVLVPTESSTDTEVKAMYVWIPRYSYTIKSEDGTNYYGKTLSSLGGSTASQATPGAIDIKFISTSTVETGTAQYTGDTASNWRTHPAFMWDTNSNGRISSGENITGIWVGKFETSVDTSSTCYSSPSTSNCNDTNITPYILPNVNSLRYQRVYEQFVTNQKFATYLTNSTNTNSHMMKNSEWGAVVYLSQSIYGKYGNSDYTGTNKEVYKNNSSSYYTGRSSGVPPSSSMSSAGTCYYDNITDRGSGTGACGAGASTTGNITGIYDMVGGSFENVMSYLTTASRTWGATSNYGNLAGFSRAPARKYYDGYTGTTSTTACNGGICYGQALSETSGWYSDSASFVNANSPWFSRGRHYGNGANAGVFSSGYTHGGANDYSASRGVLLAEGA